jgi:pilus assembly protein Flp/PilA
VVPDGILHTPKLFNPTTPSKVATAIEYGLIAALIAVGIIVAASALGGSLSSLFNRISGHLDNAT